MAARGPERGLALIPTAPSVPLAQRTAQYSFIDLYRRGLAYRASAPTIWCPLCRTAIAQAEVDDLQRGAEFLTLAFRLDDRATLSIATTRPELLPACVAIFVHPGDERYRSIIGRSAEVPILGKRVPILSRSPGGPDQGHRRGDVLHLWRRHRRVLVAHP